MKSSYNVEVEYDVLISKTRRWGEVIRHGGKIDIKDINEAVKNIYITVEESRDNLIKKVFSKKKVGNIKSYESEAVDICILSLVVGNDLELNNNELMTLGISALLKDVGMNMISEDILDKTEKLTKDELNEIEKHPSYSIEILEKHGITGDIHDVILEHHERWDGLGYPNGLSGQDISVLARIITVVDGFNALKKDRPYRKSVYGYEAIKEIIGDNAHRYDPSILEAVVKNIGIYPIGSYVALNDASICQVISTNKEFPLKPTVKVIINKNGTESKSDTVIDLTDNLSYFIVKNVPES